MVTWGGSLSLACVKKAFILWLVFLMHLFPNQLLYNIFWSPPSGLSYLPPAPIHLSCPCLLCVLLVLLVRFCWVSHEVEMHEGLTSDFWQLSCYSCSVSNSMRPKLHFLSAAMVRGKGGPGSLLGFPDLSAFLKVAWEAVCVCVCVGETGIPFGRVTIALCQPKKSFWPWQMFFAAVWWSRL